MSAEHRLRAEGQLRACASPALPHLASAPIGQAIHRLLLIQAFRPDRLLAMAHIFVSTNLGESFMSIMEQPLDLTHIVDTEVPQPCVHLLGPDSQQNLLQRPCACCRPWTAWLRAPAQWAQASPQAPCAGLSSREGYTLSGRTISDFILTPAPAGKAEYSSPNVLCAWL